MRRFYNRKHLASLVPYLNLLRARELRRGALRLQALRLRQLD